MIKQPPEQLLELIAKMTNGGSFHFTPVYVCDNCGDESKEAFPYHVYDAQGKFWDDLCNDCYDKLGCSVPDHNELCPICSEEMTWIDCTWCSGDGYIDETETDPFEGDEFATCSECDGDGGWMECPNVPHSN